MALKDRGAALMHRADVGEDWKCAVHGEDILLPGKSQRSGPAQPQALKSREPAADHFERQKHGAAARIERNPGSPVIFDRHERGCLQGELGASGMAFDRNGHGAVESLPDVRMAGEVDAHLGWAARTQRIHQAEQDDRKRPSEREKPAPRRDRCDRERDGRAGGSRDDG